MVTTSRAAAAFLWLCIAAVCIAAIHRQIESGQYESALVWAFLAGWWLKPNKGGAHD